MGLNIENPETHRLAEELATRTGESIRLDRVRRGPISPSIYLERLARTALSDRRIRIDRSITTNCFLTIEGYPDDRRHVCAGRNPSQQS